MARLPRLCLPGQVHHVIQRGNNAQAIFLGPTDYQQMLVLLSESARQFKVAVHAFVLMGNHFHLLLTPSDEHGLSRMMQAIGRSYVRYFNQARSRTGTLWEGRYKSTVIQAETYLRASMAYMDLNPVRSGLVAEAQDYPWSSYAHYVGLRQLAWLTPHPMIWAMGNTPFAREAAYVDWVAQGLARELQQQLTDSALHGWVLGDQHFVDQLQSLTSRRLSKSRPGRPHQTPSKPSQP